MANIQQVTNVKTTMHLYASVSLAWSAVPNTRFYQIAFKLAGSNSWLNAPSVPAPTTNTVITGLTPGATYNFKIFAVGA